MNRTQFIEAISERSGLSRGEAKRGLDAFVEVLTSTLKEGDKVALVGFGTFVVEKKGARMGRDPRNGAPIKIAARNVVKFRPGQELCDQIK
jgi:DNA-binding protein HU-beta